MAVAYRVVVENGGPCECCMKGSGSGSEGSEESGSGSGSDESGKSGSDESGSSGSAGSGGSGSEGSEGSEGSGSGSAGSGSGTEAGRRSDCCPDYDLPLSVYVTFGGALASLGTVELIYDGGVTPPAGGLWRRIVTFCGGDLLIQINCLILSLEGSSVRYWELLLAHHNAPADHVTVLAQCNPVFADFGTFPVGGGCGGDTTAVLTETPP